MALPRPLAPPTGISAAAKRALMGPGGAGTGRGLPAPTAEVCQINSSPRNCPGRSGGEEGSETRRPTAHPRQGASSARGKAAQRPKRGELRGAARSCGTGPGGRRMPPRVKPPPPPRRNRSTSAMEPWPRSQEGLMLLSGWSGRVWVTGAAQRGPGQEHPRTEEHPIAGHRPGARPAPLPRSWQALTRLLPYNGERNLRSPLNLQNKPR